MSIQKCHYWQVDINGSESCKLETFGSQTLPYVPSNTTLAILYTL